MKTFLLLALLTIWATVLHADEVPESTDVLFLKNETSRAGRLVGFDDEVYRLQVEVIPGQPLATITIPKEEVVQIEFADDEERDAFLQRATGVDVLEAARYWGAGERFLSQPRSPAARVGLRYGEILLQGENLANQERALQLFERIEHEAWSPEDRAAARQGRLRGLIRTGRAEEAVEEARELAESSEDPAVLIEAKFILGAASDSALRELEEEHPRWEEDIFVRPERHRLYHEALDYYLHAPLFFGSMIEPASRGLWSAAQIYYFGGDTQNAVETARDVVILYPSSPQARKATEWLASLPEEITQYDNEKDAQDQLE